MSNSLGKKWQSKTPKHGHEIQGRRKKTNNENVAFSLWLKFVISVSTDKITDKTAL